MTREAVDAGPTLAALEAEVRRLGLRMSCDRRVSEADAAQLLGVSVRTLATWRSESKVAHFALGVADAGRVSFRLDDLAAFVDSRRVSA